MTAYTAKSVKIFKTLFRLSIAALVISILSQMVITNSVAIKSSELVELQDKKAQLEKEITSLEFESSNISSLSYIEEQAVALGFVRMTEGIIAVKDPTTAAAVSVQ